MYIQARLLLLLPLRIGFCFGLPCFIFMFGYVRVLSMGANGAAGVRVDESVLEVLVFP